MDKYWMQCGCYYGDALVQWQSIGRQKYEKEYDGQFIFRLSNTDGSN
jgi:hypothetical protein